MKCHHKSVARFLNLTILCGYVMTDITNREEKSYSSIISHFFCKLPFGFEMLTEFARSVSRVKPETKELLMTAFDIDDDTLLNMKLSYYS